MSEYERQKIEYESALNAAKDKWFYAREKSVERSPNSEFIYAGGFRMAWEQLQAEIAENLNLLSAAQGVLSEKNKEIAALKADNARLTFRIVELLGETRALLEESAALKAELARAREMPNAVAVRLYNLGYHTGHEHTVEGCYTHIYECDMDEYHDDVVADILKEQG